MKTVHVLPHQSIMAQVHVTAGTTVGIAAGVQLVDKGSPEAAILAKSATLPPVEDAATACSVSSIRGGYLN